MAENTAKGTLGMAGGALADIRNLARETADLFRQLTESSHRTGQIGSLALAGAGVVLVSAILVSLAMVHLLASQIPDQPIWMSYAAIGLPILGIGIALLAIARHRLNSFGPLRKQSAKVMRDATGAVEHAGETVDAARKSLHDSAESVREALDLHEQFNKRPWTLVAGAMSLGFLGGAVLHDDESAQRAPSTNGTAHNRGMLAHMLRQIEPEIVQLKGLALGALLGAVRDFASKSSPQRMGGDVESVMNGITVKLGGTPVQGHVLREPSAGNGASSERH